MYFIHADLETSMANGSLFFVCFLFACLLVFVYLFPKYFLTWEEKKVSFVKDSVFGQLLAIDAAIHISSPL